MWTSKTYGINSLLFLGSRVIRKLVRSLWWELEKSFCGLEVGWAEVIRQTVSFLLVWFVYQFTSGLNLKEITAKGLEGSVVIIWMCSVMSIMIFLSCFIYFCKKDKTILWSFQFRIKRGYKKNCGVSQLQRLQILQLTSHEYSQFFPSWIFDPKMAQLHNAWNIWGQDPCIISYHFLTFHLRGFLNIPFFGYWLLK